MPFASSGKRRTGSELRRRKKGDGDAEKKSSVGDATDDVPALKEEETLSKSSTIKRKNSDIKKQIPPIRVKSLVNRNSDKEQESDSESSSDGSLLSSFSEEDEKDDELIAEYKGILRLEKKLEIRKKKLRRLSAGMSPSLVTMLQAHEEAARDVKLFKHKQQQQGTGKTTGKASNENSTTSRSGSRATGNVSSVKRQHLRKHSLFLRTWWHLVFEFHHTVPSSFKLIIICACHLTFHGVIDTGLRILYHNVLQDYFGQQFYGVCQIIFGLWLLRANGYLWQFLEHDAYNTVKFDMHNRWHLGFLDARVLSFFKSSLLASACNMFGFYFVYVGLNQLVAHGFLVLLKFLEDWYINTRTRIIEEHHIPEESLQFYSWEGLSTHFSEAEYQTCMMLKQYVKPQFRWWFQYCCTDPFQEWKGLEMFYFGAGLLVAALIAASMGLNVLKFCDEE
mmetsp:Transcript_28075/g.49785  ORF Transcript_28075/g.49785 Transcript_28075/m.49785 type:complete len:449 (+) Transcript_28075:64-1410(+)